MSETINERPAVLFGPYGTVLEGLSEDKDFANPARILGDPEHRENVVRIAKGYSEIADIATTHSFGLRALLRNGLEDDYRLALKAQYDAVREAVAGLELGFIVPVGPYGVSNGGCYNPEEAADTDTSRDFHGLQLGRVKELGALDRVLFETVSTIDEAVGIAQAARAAGVPSVLSFVVDDQGKLYEGQTLSEAIRAVDGATNSFLDGFSVNCCPIDGVHKAFDASNGQRSRLIAAYPNASSEDPRSLEEHDGIVVDLHPDVAAEDLTRVYGDNPGLSIVGGCCGFDKDALKILRDGIVKRVGENARPRI